MKLQAKTFFGQWLVLACAMFFQAGISGRELVVRAAGRNAQDAFPILKGPYWGQKWSGPGAELFAPHIVSTGLMESSIALAPDGRSCYFAVTLSPALSVIVEMKQEKGIWIVPEVAGFSYGRGDGNPTMRIGRILTTENTESTEGQCRFLRPGLLCALRVLCDSIL